MTEARVRPDARWLLYVVTVAVFALYVFGAIVSFAGLYGIASWLILPPVLYWSFPLAVDLAIIVYKIAEVILKHDDRKAHKVKKAVFGSLIFTAISSAGNVIHVANANDPDPLKFWGGIFFAGLMPWAVYLAASVLTDLIVQPLRIEREEPAQEGADRRTHEWEISLPNFPVSEEMLENDNDDTIRLRTQEMFKARTEGPSTLVFRQGGEEPAVGDKVETFSVTRDIKPFPSSWGSNGSD